jgi:hypothetical protein
MAFPYKTWVNGVDVANAANLQRYDDWIRQAEGSTPSPPSVSGQTSGTATCYQILQGTVKEFLVILANYKNTGSQYLTLPTAFTTRAWFDIGDTGGGHISFYTGGSGGSAVNCMQITALGSGGGTAAGPQSFTSYFGIGQVNAAFDTIQFQANSSAANGIMIVKGI